MGRLEIALLAGEESKSFLANLARQIDRLEALVEKSPVKVSKKEAAALDEDEDDSDDDSDEVETKVKKGGKKAASLDDDEGEDDEDEDDAPVKKSAKSKKVTLSDVKDACKVYMRENSRADVLKILKKQFKVESTEDLDEEDYADVIKAVEVD